MANNTNTIEVVYPLACQQRVLIVDLDSLNNGNLNIFTILDIINISGILDIYPEIDLKVNKVGIYGEIKNLTDLVKPQDRIEIYRPLVIDPMAARRLRAAKQKQNITKK